MAAGGFLFGILIFFSDYYETAGQKRKLGHAMVIYLIGLRLFYWGMYSSSKKWEIRRRFMGQEKGLRALAFQSIYCVLDAFMHVESLNFVATFQIR